MSFAEPIPAPKLNVFDPSTLIKGMREEKAAKIQRAFRIYRMKNVLRKRSAARKILNWLRKIKY